MLFVSEREPQRSKIVKSLVGLVAEAAEAGRHRLGKEMETREKLIPSLNLMLCYENLY